MSKLTLAGYLLIFAAGIVVGVTFVSQYLPTVAPILSQNKEIRLGGYKFISPLLECEDSQNIGNIEYKPSKDKILKLLDNSTKSGNVSYVSVYYRDLNNGPWFGVNEKTLFSPASLLKVPIMIAFYKASEKNPAILDKKIKFTAETPADPPYFPPSKTITVGETYTVDELIKRMIIYSDNQALDLVGTQIKDNQINQVTFDLGIETPIGETPENYISVKNYAALFRVLYNASYLSKDDSEKALNLLSQIDFKEGLNKGVPKNIIIAHKFGERELEDKSKQLHDCGIVYYPRHPYLICVMTRGTDYNKLSNLIGQISAEIYGDINSRYSQK